MRIYTVAILLLFSVASNANSFRYFQIEYGSNGWNKNSTQIDTAYMYVQDPVSKKIAKVVVEESEPDSSVFSGKFSLDLAKDKNTQVNVYMPPENMRASPALEQQYYKKLQSGEIARQPTLLREMDGYLQFDVYDTPAQLKKAQELYSREVKAKSDAERTKNIKPVADINAIAAAQLVAKQKLLAQLAAEAARRQAERLRQEQLEAQKRKMDLEKAARLSVEARRRNQAEAKRFSAMGMDAYKKADFEKSAQYFKRATELDPQSNAFYLQYGVALYRTEKLNDALVILSQVGDDPASRSEKKYYTALIHFRLQEYDRALKLFNEIKAANIPTLSVSASFYAGVSLLAQEKLEESQKEFEWVIDNSQDSALDKKAEEYIEKIAALIQFKKKMDRKWGFGARMAATYDSNILLTPASSADQTLGISSDDGGVRAMLQGDASRRLFLKEQSSGQLQASSMYMYSLDSQFNTADPWLSNLGFKFEDKNITAEKKSYQYNITPSYEVLYMDEDDDGTRDLVSTSLILASDVTFIMRDDYFANYGLEVRSDDSQLEDQATDDNADSLKYTIKTNQTRFLDATKKRALSGVFGYTSNAADGDNKTYMRIDAGATYVQPAEMWKNTMWSVGLAAYQLDYTKADDGRKDFNLSLTYSLSRSLNENWTAIGIASYANNSSSEDSNTYSKYSMMALLGYTY